MIEIKINVNDFVDNFTKWRTRMGINDADVTGSDFNNFIVDVYGFCESLEHNEDTVIIKKAS